MITAAFSWLHHLSVEHLAIKAREGSPYIRRIRAIQGMDDRYYPTSTTPTKASISDDIHDLDAVADTIQVHLDRHLLSLMMASAR